MKKSLLFVLIFVFSALMTSVQASEIVGTVRVSFLSETLVRLEEKGPQGYCDEQTFHIPERASFSEVHAVRTEEDGSVCLSTASYSVYLPANATTLDNIYIMQNGSPVWAYASVINNQAQLPAPGETCYAYSIADNPRIIVPAHGYAYNPAAGANNGWNLNNDARDVYVFLPQNDHVQLRKDFVQLTGRTEMIPLWALGAWDSRYYPYSDIASYNRVDAYRNNGLPLDVFVVDTDWRQPSGGVVGTGYTINTSYFPDITGFTNHMHNNKHVRLVFNDHPEPTDSNTLSAAETKFRTENLQRILSYGVDAWWYDRNWHVTINSPSSAIPNHAFGMYAYHSITQNFAPNRRPMLLSNIVGVGGGYKEFATNISSHRFSVQWTGDIWADDQSLWREIEHVAREGAISALPYVSADIGGHLKNPTTDGYIRWVQFGTFSPIYRLHCAAWTVQENNGQTEMDRAPWTWGSTALSVAREYTKMRYRLLPLYYTLSHENYETGLPMMRRLDFNYPEHKESGHNDQYLLGNDILIAPLAADSDNTTSSSHDVTSSWFPNGLKAYYYNNPSLSGEPVLTMHDTELHKSWGTGAPNSVCGADNFSVTWDGEIQIASEDDIVLGVKADDGVNVYIDGEAIIASWEASDSGVRFGSKILRAGETYHLRVDYYEGAGNASIKLIYALASDKIDGKDTRLVFIPDGIWRDVWTGKEYEGPKTIRVSHGITTSPLFVRRGGIIPLAQDMLYSSEKTWQKLALEIYPSTTETGKVQLYEDDTESVAYKSGAFRTTDIESTYENGVHTLTVNPAIGTFSGADKFSTRTFTFRIHAPENWGSMTYARINGQPVGAAEYVRDGSASPFAFSGGARDGRMIEITYTASLSEKIVLQYAFSQESSLAFDGFGSFKVFDASVSTPDAAINLTDLGVVDYLHVNPQSVGNVVRKANRANSVLGAFSAGSGTGVFHDGRTNYTWNDGNPIAYTSGTTSGFTNATGFTLRLNASTAPRTVTVFLGGWQSKSLLKIADDSGNIIKTFSFENLSGTYDKAVTFTVQATNAGTPVYLYYTMVKTSATGGNISFTAAAVTEAADNATVEKISSVASATSLNLTKQGYSDWAVFGTASAVDVQKKSCPRESSIHKFSYGKTPLQFVDNRVLISWEDGALTKENTGTRNGPVIDSSSFSTAVKATSTPKYITFYVGGWKSNARFTVTDADGDTLYTEDFGDASTNYYRTIKLKVQAPADEWLYVTYTHTNPGNGNITFSAITVAPEFYSLRDKNGHFEIYNNADTKVMDAIVADYDADGRLIYADLVPLTVTDMEKIGENASLSENARLYMLDSLESLNPVQ